MKKLAEIYKALSDETRLMIIALITNHGECCVCDVMGVLSLSQSKASRHLRYLKNAGLLTNRRAGTWVYYKIPEKPSKYVEQILTNNREIIAWAQSDELKKRMALWKKKKKNGNCSKLEKS
ncbi:MAG: ArsR/SmtB family transcription factor [Myxococcota bacterium]